MTPRLCLVGRQQTRIQVGVDRHLLSRQGIQRKARRNFGHAASALSNDDQIDNHQNGEDEKANDVIATNQERAKGLDDMPRRCRTIMTIDKHHAGRCDIQREAKDCREQQYGWKG